MNLTVSGDNLAVTPAIRSYVRSKLGRVVRHFDGAIGANVILSVQKLRQKAEATVHVRGKDIYAESDDADLYAAIDLLMDKLDRRMQRHKDRTQAHGHQGLKRRPAGDED